MLKGVRMRTEPFDIDRVMERIRERMEQYPKAAMFELAEMGYRSTFEQLVACIISIRTLDEVTLVQAPKLFAKARTPAEMASLTPEEIDRLIAPSQFHEQKAYQIREMAVRIRDEFDGELPCDLDVMLSFRGVGIKCAHLALGIACGMPFISVDVHVHRVTNRWGYVATRTPEQTTRALEQVLPERYWIEFNRIIMPFGKHICTGVRPKCSICPVESMCAQVGVTAHR